VSGQRRGLILLVSGGVMLIVVLAALWLILGRTGGGPQRVLRRLATATNPALDVRYSYDAGVFTPAPYDGHADYPLRLNSPAGPAFPAFSFYGKRIRGLGRMLAKEPGPILYDFVGQENDSAFEQWYGLKPLSPPKYEDARLGGKLGLHQKLEYGKVPGKSAWPLYFPDSVKAGDKVYIEGWTLFSKDDLFFFYAVSPEPLGTAQRNACLIVLNSLKFGAVLGNAQAPEPAPQPAPQPEGGSPSPPP